MAQLADRPQKIVCLPFSLKSEMRDQKKVQSACLCAEYGPDLTGMPLGTSVRVVGGSGRDLGLNEAKMANKQTALGKKYAKRQEKSKIIWLCVHLARFAIDSGRARFSSLDFGREVGPVVCA